MKTITYNLKETDSSYYEDIASVADIVLEASHIGLDKFIEEYQNFISVYRLENERTYEEYLFDMLSFGVYLKIYLKVSEKTFYPSIQFSRLLYKLRQKNSTLKKIIDPVRGFWSSLFLYDKKYINSSHKGEINYDKFINWLDATGEFREEVKRFRIFIKYFNSLSISSKNKYLHEINRVTDYFNIERNAVLSKYTAGVVGFLTEIHKDYKWSEDYIFCGRREAEYHLSMVGAELMNRAFKNSFNNSKSLTVLVPACMRIHGDDKCSAVKKEFDLECMNCNKFCNIGRLKTKGRKEGFDVRIIPHSSDFSKWLKTWAAGKNIGVIGVACPLNLITGGLELKSLDIPAQCILLDYCGCKNHWDEKGFSTALDNNEFNKIIAERKSHIMNSADVNSLSVHC